MNREDWPVIEEFGPYAADCRHFNGFKPCRFKRLCDGCPHYAPQGTRILLINLDAMGDVARTTALLPALKRKYPVCHVTWLTLKLCGPILENNPLVDEVLFYGPETTLELEPREFELVCNVDKSRRSGAMAQRVRAEHRLGFGVNAHGCIVPLNTGAGYQYWTGLDDELKFRRNRRNEQQMLAETMEVEYRRDPYVQELSPAEQAFVSERRAALGLGGPGVVVGLNTGCSEAFPYKKLPVEYQARLIDALLDHHPEIRVILLGGPEDEERNPQIARQARGRVQETPCGEGLRRGILYTDLADVVVSGDSLGMHLAIGLGKRVVAWFGLSSEWEIDFYDRGEAVLAEVECRPCWRRQCAEPVKCYENVNMEAMIAAVGRQITAAAEEKNSG